MKIKVSEIPEDGLEINTEEELRGRVPGVTAPARVSIGVRRIGPEVLVKGSVGAEMELKCGLCLKAFEKEVLVSFDIVFHPAEEIEGLESHELQAHELQIEELDTGLYEGDEINMEGLFVEQLLLNTPMKPLCGKSCKGLCPGCGADLNESGCACGARDTDPRLDVLKDYFERRK